MELKKILGFRCLVKWAPDEWVYLGKQLFFASLFNRGQLLKEFAPLEQIFSMKSRSDFKGLSDPEKTTEIPAV